MIYRIGYTRRKPKTSFPPMEHALSGKWRNKAKTTALGLCGAALEPPADGFMEPGELTFGIGKNFDPESSNACRRCRRKMVFI